MPRSSQIIDSQAGRANRAPEDARERHSKGNGRPKQNRDNQSRRSTSAPFDRAALIPWALAGLLVVITVAVYFPVVHHPFVNYDDPDYVTDNAHVQQGLSWNTFAWAFTTLDCANWHPLTWLSHEADWQFLGDDASGHHATSMLLHAVNALLLFLLLWKATAKVGRSAVVAALFAIHPINVESVAWVAERKSVLCMFFLLLTLAAYGWYVRRVSLGRYVVVTLLFALALAAKPMAVTLPFALLLIDIWPLRRFSYSPATPELPSPHPLSFVALVKEKLPLFAMTAASCLITVIAQKRVIKPLQIMPIGARIVNAIYSYAAYLWKTIWPAHLTVFYSQRGSHLGLGMLTLCLAVLLLISICAWRLRSHSYILAGWLWFLGTLVPMIGIVQVGDQGMADRYAYLPLIGIFVAVVWGVSDLAVWKRIDARWLGVAACVVIAALSIVTRLQLQTWESNAALWSHSLEVTPDNYIAHDLAGLALSQDSYRATGQPCPDEALAHFRQAVALNQQDALGHLDTGYCELLRKNYQTAIDQYTLALHWAPDKYLKAKAYLNLGGVQQEMGNFAASREYYRQALQLHPNDPDVLRDMRHLNAREQIPALAKAAASNPSADAYVQIARLQESAGLPQDAVESYRHALKLDPSSVAALQALRSLGVAGP